jgi:hypothetical protein
MEVKMMGKISARVHLLKFVHFLFLIIGAFSFGWANQAGEVLGQVADVGCPVALLVVETTPVRGQVYMDGRNWGTAPQARFVFTGLHTVSFGNYASYTKPANQTVNVKRDNTTKVTGTYVLNTGVLLVDTTPVKGAVYVDGDLWGTAPESKILPPGPHVVTFGDIQGYITPVEQTATVENGKTVQAVGTYEPLPPDTGVLSVDTTPVKGEIFVDSVSWGTAPETHSLPVGAHTVSFGNVAGYDKPDNQSVTIEAGKTTDILGAYTKQTGTLSIMTTPVAGQIIVNQVVWGIAPQSRQIDIGTYTVSFGEVNGYTKPADQSLTVTNQQVTTGTGTYVVLPPLQGNLSVDTTPVKGPIFVNGEAWGTAPISKAVNVGNYTVSFGDMTGFETPQAQIVSVQEDIATNVTGTYEALLPDSGVLLVTTFPVPGSVLVDAVAWGTAPVSQLVTVGTHVVSFGEVAGFFTPADQTVVVDKDQTLRVEGEYTPLPPGSGILSVDTAPTKGQITVDNTLWGTAPERKVVSAGTHTVKFAKVPGFIPPDEKTVPVQENQAVHTTGVYVPQLYTLTETVQGEGSIQPASGSYLVGQSVLVLAVPDSNRNFSHWEGDLTGTQNPATITMDNNKSITAVFVSKPGPCCGLMPLILIPALLAAGGLLGIKVR